MGNEARTKYIPLTEVPELLPIRRRGKTLHVSTIWRWARKGANRRKLQTWQIGGTTCTTMAAIEEFIEGPKAPAVKVIDKRVKDAQTPSDVQGGW